MKAESRSTTMSSVADRETRLHDTPDELIVGFQAAQLLGVGHQRTYAMVRSGEIPAQRRSGRWWIRRAHLEAALKRARVKPGQLFRNTVPPRKGD
jgi:excisionase family DNA binding protein